MACYSHIFSWSCGFASEVSTAVRLASTNMGDLYSTGIKKKGKVKKWPSVAQLYSSMTTG